MNSQDLLFYGPLDKCPVCGGALDYNGMRYSCTGTYTEWSTCTFNTIYPPRKQAPTKIPDSDPAFKQQPISDVLYTYTYIRTYDLIANNGAELICCV